MTDRTSLAGDVDTAEYANLKDDFFSDETTLDERLKEERVRGRSASQREHAKRRAPRERTVQIGIRTTPEVRARLTMLMARLHMNTTTEVIEHALLQLDTATKGARA